MSHPHVVFDQIRATVNAVIIPGIALAEAQHRLLERRVEMVAALLETLPKEEAAPFRSILAKYEEDCRLIKEFIRQGHIRFAVLLKVLEELGKFEEGVG